MTVALSEVAERLDLAMDDQNAVATALDLARGANPSLLVSRAIANGIDVLTSSTAFEPVTEPATFRHGRGLKLVGLGLSVMGLAYLIPTRPPLMAAGRDDRTPTSSPFTKELAFAGEDAADEPRSRPLPAR